MRMLMRRRPHEFYRNGPDADSVKEITPGDCPVHTQAPITRVHHSPHSNQLLRSINGFAAPARNVHERRPALRSLYAKVPNSSTRAGASAHLQESPMAIEQVKSVASIPSPNISHVFIRWPGRGCSAECSAFNRARFIRLQGCRR